MDSKIGALVIVLLLGTATACGGGTNHENVWLYVFNGYPGSDGMSMYGPSGTVTTGLGFGQRTPAPPPSVDRNLGTSFELVLEGAPQTFEVDLPLYDMYPHETATVFFKRRTGTDSIDDPMIFRHVQTGYREEANRCRLIFDNALSVQNDEIGVFDYLPAAKIRPSCSGYVDQIGTFDDTGQMVETPSGNQIEVGRPGLVDRIKETPWFFLAEAESGQVLDIRNEGDPTCGMVPENNRSTDGDKTEVIAGEHAVNFVWAPEAEIDFSSGSFRAPAPTRQYMNCIGWDPDKDPEQQNIKSEQVLACQKTQNNAEIVQLSNQINSYRFGTGIGLKLNDEPVPNGQCGFGTRVFSDFFNVFEEPQGEQPSRLATDIQFGPSQYFFWVLYGRPVNPLVEAWGANTPDRGGGFVDVPPYPGMQGTAR